MRTFEIMNLCLGAKIYLIGTAHFSQESCDDVSRIIMAVQPDIVMVELCKQGIGQSFQIYIRHILAL